MEIPRFITGKNKIDNLISHLKLQPMALDMQRLFGEK